MIPVPYQHFIDPTATRLKAVDNGFIYLGVQDKDPTIPENQLSVFYIDENGNTIQVPQPILLNATGVPCLKNGTVYSPQVSTQYASITLQNKSGTTIYEHKSWPILNQYRKDLASSTGLVYVGEWQPGIVIPDKAMTDKLAYWYDGQLYSVGTDTGFTSNDFNADLSSGKFVSQKILSISELISLTNATPISELGAKPTPGFDNGLILQAALDKGGYYYFDKLGVYESHTKLWMKNDRSGFVLNGSTIKSMLPPVAPPMTQGKMRDESIFFKIGEGNADNIYQITEPMLIGGTIDANDYGVGVSCRTANKANISLMNFKGSQGVGLDYQNSDNGTLHDLNFIDCAPDPSLAWSETETEAYGDGMHVWIGSQSNDIKRVRIINTRQSASSAKVARAGFIFEGQGNKEKETKNNTAELVHVRGYDRGGHTEGCGINNTFISPDFLVNESIDKKTFGAAYIAWGNKDVQIMRGGSILADSIAFKLTGNKRKIQFEGTKIQVIKGLFMSNSEYVNDPLAYNDEVEFNSCWISYGGGFAQWFGGKYVFNHCDMYQSDSDKTPNLVNRSEFIINHGTLNGVILSSQYGTGEGDVVIELNHPMMTGYKSTDSNPAMSLGNMNGGGRYYLNDIKTENNQNKSDLRFVLTHRNINITSSTSFAGLPYSIFGADQTRGYMCNGEFWAYDIVSSNPPPRVLEIGTRVNAISASRAGDITQWICTAVNTYKVTQKIIE